MTPKERRTLFKKYMKVKNPDKAHAVLSASGSERWLSCPRSVKLSEGITSVDNEWGIRGTNTHTLIQFILENTHTWQELILSQEAEKFKSFIDYDIEMQKCADFAVNYVKKEQRRMLNRYGVKPQLYIEQKLELLGVGFGTADIILYHPFGLLHVMDYKNGRFNVEPESNTQGLYYGVASADKFGWDFREAWITIIQPNADNRRGPIRTWEVPQGELEKAQTRFRLGAGLTKKKDAPLVPDSKYCWFCPARQTKCPIYNKKRHEKIMERFER